MRRWKNFARTETMLFDTDVFIWLQRGSSRAAALIDRTPERFLSLFSLLELLQGAQNKRQQRLGQSFLRDLNFRVLSLTEPIGHRALIYIEQHALSSGLRAGDAIVAATAVENGLALASANRKHFSKIEALDLVVFRP